MHIWKYPSIQTVSMPMLHLPEQGVSVQVTSVWSQYYPQLFTHLGHTVTCYLHRKGILVLANKDDWLVHHLNQDILVNYESVLLQTLNLVGFKLNVKKLKGKPVKDIQLIRVKFGLINAGLSFQIRRQWK